MAQAGGEQTTDPAGTSTTVRGKAHRRQLHHVGSCSPSPLVPVGNGEQGGRPLKRYAIAASTGWRTQTVSWVGAIMELDGGPCVLPSRGVLTYDHGKRVAVRSLWTSRSVLLKARLQRYRTTPSTHYIRGIRHGPVSRVGLLFVPVRPQIPALHHVAAPGRTTGLGVSIS